MSETNVDREKCRKNSTVNCFDNFYGVKHIDRLFACVCVFCLVSPRWYVPLHTMHRIVLSFVCIEHRCIFQRKFWKRSLFHLLFAFYPQFVVIVVIFSSSSFLVFFSLTCLYTRNIQYMYIGYIQTRTVYILEECIEKCQRARTLNIIVCMYLCVHWIGAARLLWLSFFFLLSSSSSSV